MILFPLLLGCGVDLTGILPTVKFERFDVTSVDFEHIETDFVFRVDNPNPVGAPVDRFAYSLSMMGVEILSGADPAGLELVAGGSSEVALPVGLDFANLWEAVTAARGEDFVEFGLAGGIGVDTDIGPVDVTFDEHGDFPALRVPKVELGKLRVTQFDGTTLNLGLDIGIDNEHESTLGFRDIAFGMKLAGVDIGDGSLDEDVDVDGASTEELELPISINVWDFAEAAGQILAGEPVDLELDLGANVNTPFGLLPLTVDERGNVEIE